MNALHLVLVILAILCGTLEALPVVASNGRLAGIGVVCLAVLFLVK